MRKKSILTLSLCGVIIILLAVIGVLFWKYQQTDDTGSKNKETSQRIIQKVSDMYMLPSGEEPTVARIQDKNKLGNQDFFKTAQNGDYLLIYQKAKLAIVYREDLNKLVTVGPVNIDDAQKANGQTAGAQTETETSAAP